MSRARDLGSSINSLVAGKNVIINGGMDIWQRGISFTPANGQVYTADRWFTWSNFTGTPITVSRTSSGLTGMQYAMRIQKVSGNSQVSSFFLNSALETSNSIPFAGKVATFSFYYRKGSGYTGGTINYAVQTGSSTNESGIGGFSSNNANPISGSVTPTLEWQKLSTSALIPSTTTQISPVFYSVHSGTSDASDWYEVTGFQLEISSVATTFSRSGGDIQGELAACQRYYYTSTMNKHLGAGRDSALAFFTKDFPVQMRTIPSFNSNVATKAVSGSFPGTAGQVGFYGDGWIATNASALVCAGDGTTPDLGSFYIQGYAITVGKIFSIQTENLTNFNWSAEL
jgi:hypothetical protein